MECGRALQIALHRKFEDDDEDPLVASTDARKSSHCYMIWHIGLQVKHIRVSCRSKHVRYICHINDNMFKS